MAKTKVVKKQEIVKKPENFAIDLLNNEILQLESKGKAIGQQFKILQGEVKQFKDKKAETEKKIVEIESNIKKLTSLEIVDSHRQALEILREELKSLQASIISCEDAIKAKSRHMEEKHKAGKNVVDTIKAIKFTMEELEK